MQAGGLGMLLPLFLRHGWKGAAAFALLYLGMRYLSAPMTNSRSCSVTHVDFRPVKLRLPGRRSTTETAPDTSADQSELVKTTGKGRPTPKRTEAAPRCSAKASAPQTMRPMPARKATIQTTIKLLVTPVDRAR